MRGPGATARRSPEVTMTPLDEQHVAAEFEAFLRAQFPATADGVGREVDLFDTGVIDSVGVAETIAFIEERYAVEIPDELLLSDQFTSIAGIAHSIVQLADACSQ
jgi:acyl carrier protein